MKYSLVAADAATIVVIIVCRWEAQAIEKRKIPTE